MNVMSGMVSTPASLWALFFGASGFTFFAYGETQLRESLRIAYGVSGPPSTFVAAVVGLLLFGIALLWALNQVKWARLWTCGFLLAGSAHIVLIMGSGADVSCGCTATPSNWTAADQNLLSLAKNGALLPLLTVEVVIDAYQSHSVVLSRFWRPKGVQV
jgi:hypothetical protein